MRTEAADFAGALADAQAVSAADPGSPGGLFLRAGVNLAAGRLDAAFADYREILGRSPQEVGALLGRGEGGGPPAGGGSRATLPG